MNTPNDALSGSNAATITVTKQEDGSFKAACPNIEGLAPVVAETEAWAIRQMSQKVRDFYFRGLSHG